jgi:hypothetical protein
VDTTTFGPPRGGKTAKTEIPIKLFLSVISLEKLKITKLQNYKILKLQKFSLGFFGQIFLVGVFNQNIARSFHKNSDFWPWSALAAVDRVDCFSS